MTAIKLLNISGYLTIQGMFTICKKKKAEGKTYVNMDI